MHTAHSGHRPKKRLAGVQATQKIAKEGFEIKRIFLPASLPPRAIQFSGSASLGRKLNCCSSSPAVTTDRPPMEKNEKKD
jgi:hypothetical protein